MRSMFNGAYKFNQHIGRWNTSNVTDMEYMFHNAKCFNQPIGKWNTSKVTNMMCMFSCAVNFNQYIGEWDISNVTRQNMICMFCFASFNSENAPWYPYLIK